MKIEWDFKELFDFGDNLKSLGSAFDKHLKTATRDIAKALLKRMKSLTPVDGYDLINGWDGNQFLVTGTNNGYEVLIVNKDPKALWVNDGHLAKNQYGGPYPIKHRIQVRTPHQWQTGDGTWYVFGHFFVERGILQLNNTNEIEQIIMRELQKWWDSI